MSNTATMTESEAIAYAAEWGSYMNGGDPGACMYGFSPEIGLKVQSEQHRAACLAHIDDCIERCDPEGNDAHDEDDPDKLAELRRMIEAAPLTDD